MIGNVAPEATMSRLTIFLSRLLGLFLLLLAITFFWQRQTVVETIDMLINDRSMVLVFGMIALACGLAMVISHNVWTGGAVPVVVTILGWLFLIRGVLLLALPPAEVSSLYGLIQFGRFFDFYEIVLLVIGAFLTYGGFRAHPPSEAVQTPKSGLAS